MRKHLLFALALVLLAPWTIRAQELTVCEGTDENFRLPFWSAYCDQGLKSEFIYPASMLTQMVGGTISSIEFTRRADANDSYPVSTNWPGVTFKVYMDNVTGTEYASEGGGTFQATADAQLVYEGTFTLSNFKLNIELEEPFVYTGNDLLISISNTGGIIGNWFHEYWYGVNQSTYCGGYNTGSSAANSTSYSGSAMCNFLPQCTFSYTTNGGTICRRVSDLNVIDITDEEATLTFVGREGHNSFQLVYKTESAAPTDDEIDNAEDLGDDTFYVFSGLDPQTTYYVYVRAECDGGGMSSWASTMFTTACTMLTHDNLPITETFDSYSSGSTGTINPCWNKFTEYSTNYPYPYEYYHHGATGNSLYFYAGSNQYNYVVMQPVTDLNGLMLTFWTYASSPASAQMQVGIMSDPTDASTFTPIFTTPTDIAASTWVQHEAIVPTGTEAHYIAFRNWGTAYTNIYLDDITLMVAPDCMHPATIATSNLTPTSVTIELNDPGEVGRYVLTVNGEQMEETDETSIELTELTPATAYTVSVVSICGDNNDTTTSISVSFRTPCTAITANMLPLVEDFESYPASTQQIECWTRHTNYGSYPQTYSISATTVDGESVGGMAYYMYTYAYSGNFLVSPYIESLDGLMASCYMRQVSSNTTAAIGLMTDPADTNTFLLITAEPTVSGTWVNIEAYFSNVENIEDYHYVAFRGTVAGSGTSSYGGLYIDNLRIGLPPSCPKPQDVTVSDITETSATLSWTDAGEGSSFRVSYTVAGEQVNAETDTPTIDLADLQTNTAYTVSIVALCGDDAESDPRLFTFRTACGTITAYPWTEGFEGTFASDPSYQYQTLVPCWDMIHTSTTQSYTSIASTGHTGSQSLRFFPGDALSLYAILPSMENVSTLEMTFWAKAENATSSGTLEVGYMTDPTDASTFVATYSVLGTDHTADFVQEDATFAGAPEGARIAFHQASNAWNYFWWIDDIDVHIASGCTRPAVSASDVTPTTATINFTGEAESYRLVVSAGDTVDVTGTSYELPDLTANTQYTMYGIAVCDGGEQSRPAPVVFRTLCAYEDFPFHFTQADMLAVQSPGFDEPCWDWNGYYRSSSNGVGYVYSNGSTTEFRLPAVDVDLNTAQLRTMVACTTANQSFRVGVRDGNVTTWVDTIAINQTATSTAGEYYEVALTRYTGNGHRVVVGNMGSSSVYFLDFHVEPISSCPAVSGITATDVTETSATISWTSNGDESEWQVLVNGQVAGTVSTNSVTLDTLRSSLVYTVSIQAVCGDEETSSERSVKFHTACVMLTHADLPLEEGFDTYATGTGNDIDLCWNRISLASAYAGYPYVYGSTSHGNTGNSLYFYPGYSYEPELAVLPAIDDLSDLYIRFWGYRNSASVRMEVGVMTDPEDASTFELVEACEPSTTYTWEEFNVSLASYTGEGHYIALRGMVTSGYGYGFYVDDVRVAVLNECASAIRSILFSDISDQEATVSWQPGFGLYDDATVVLKTADGTTVATATVSDGNEYTFSGLTAETVYEVEVSLNCNGDVVATETRSFSTRCANGTTLELSATTLNLTAGTNMRFPVHGWFKHSYTNMVYTAHEMGNAAMTISSISYHHNFSNNFTGYTGEIYMGHVSDSVLNSLVDYNTLTLVYTGSFDMENGWNEFLLDMPFVYNGTDHLVIGIRASAAADAGQNNRFSSHTVVSGMVRYDANDNNAITTINDGTAQTDRPDVIFGNCGGTTPQPVGIDAADMAAVRLYPNPATSSVSVEFEGVATVSVIDLNGRQVMSAEADSRATFDVSSLAKGAYFVRVTSAAGTAVSKLVVK